MKNRGLVQSSFRKIGATVLTQAVVLGLSVITGFILPTKMGPEMYGYWQIYIFYLAYLNLFGLGFNDGVALFYGGYDYQKMPFERMRGAVRVLLMYLAAATLALAAAAFFIGNAMQREIYWMLAINMPLICIQCVILTIFLSVNRTGVYNGANLAAKVAATGFYLILLLAGITSAGPMMYADSLSRLILTVACVILGREFIFGKASGLKIGLQEFGEKSKAGIQITLAIIASTFIPVFARVIVEWNEPIEVYGIFSFAMTLLSIIILFTNTAGTVVFPLLKRLPSERLPEYYPGFSFVCDSLIFVALLAYIPLLYIVKNIMTEYIPVLAYLHIILVMSVPLGKMQLLLTPYYKAFRLEKAFLYMNLAGLALMAGGTYAVYLIFRSVISLAICSAAVLTLWTLFSEYYLVKRVGGRPDVRNTLIRILVMASFVVAGGFGIPLFIAVYVGTLVIYFAIYRHQLKKIIRQTFKNHQTGV